MALPFLYRRRPWSPYRIEGLAMRYDASVASALTADAAGKVSAWRDLSGAARHLAQGTGAAQPQLLPFAGERYAFLPGVAGNYVSTPSSAALNITGDLTLSIDMQHASWRPSAQGGLVGKWTGQYLLALDPAGTLTYYYNDGATKFATSTAALPSAAARRWVQVRHDVNNGASGSDVSFWYRATTTDAWTQLGTTITTAGVVTRATSATAVEVGTWAGGTNPTAGLVYLAEIGNGLGDAATVVARCEPRRGAHAAGTFVAGTGETWTINQSGGLPAVLVGNAAVAFDGTDDILRATVAGLGTIASPFTTMAIVQMVAIPSNKFVAEVTGSAVNGHGFSIAPTNAARVYLNATSTQYLDTGLAFGTGKIYVLAATFDGTTRRTAIGSTLGATQVDTGVATTTVDSVALGGLHAGALFANMRLHEWLHFRTAVPTATLQRAGQWLAQKWGTT